MHDIGKALKFSYSFMRKRLVHLNLQILFQCNFRCSICDFWKEPYISMPQMQVSDARVIADKLKKNAPLIVTIGGGEPLLHPGVIDIIRAFSRDHFPVMICNGWFMTERRARELFEAGLYEVSISVDYADPEKHDRLRGMPGAFERAVAGLEMLHRNRVDPSQRVHMISVIMDDNLDQIEPLILLAKKMGITYLVTLYSHGRGTKATRTSRTDISQHLLALRQKYSNFVGVRGYLSRFSEAASGGGVNPCYAGKNLFNIDCQGNVTRCIDRLDKVAGNMLTHDFVIIQRELVRQHQSNDCSHCWTSCRGNIETLMYGSRRLLNLWDSHQVTKGVPLVQH